MAKAKMVTRTVQTTRAKIMCVDIAQEKPYNREFILPGVYKNDSHILKKVSKLIDDENNKVVAVLSATVETSLYGMTEDKFIEMADVLPPRKAKENN